MKFPHCPAVALNLGNIFEPILVMPNVIFPNGTPCSKMKTLPRHLITFCKRLSFVVSYTLPIHTFSRFYPAWFWQTFHSISCFWVSYILTIKCKTRFPRKNAHGTFFWLPWEGCNSKLNTCTCTLHSLKKFWINQSKIGEVMIHHSQVLHKV